jgi:tetratricopeptide (TPR) repeat protein
MGTTARHDRGARRFAADLNCAPAPAWRARALVAAVMVCCAAGAFAASKTEELEARNELGVTLALGGHGARAESVFVAMLSDSRGDARALNNLGNLRVARGDLGVALAFYDRALRGDSLDAGILLNRATTLLLMGDDERSQEAAAIAVKQAGGVERAEALLGLKSEAQAKGAAPKYVSKEELRHLIRQAARSVPSDSQRVGGKEAPAGSRPGASTWRSAGPRAADAASTAVVLYWKR